MRHREIIGCVAVGLGLGVASFAGAGSAHASADDFLYDVRNNGRITGPEDQLIYLGSLVCDYRRQGASPDQTIRMILDNSGLRSVSDAQFIYESALIYMC